MTNRRKCATAGLFVLAAGAGAGVAYAGPYSDDLAKCLVESTTADDKSALVKWMFVTAALHPAVESVASVSTAERADSNRSTARLFERLLTDACQVQTRQAIKYEGSAALQTGFQMLGQVAARELFADPSVASGLGDLEKHLDADKLRRSLKAD